MGTGDYCDKVRNEMLELVEHRPNKMEDAVISHLDACEECREFYASLQWVVNTLGSATGEILSPEEIHDCVQVALVRAAKGPNGELGMPNESTSLGKSAGKKAWIEREQRTLIGKEEGSPRVSVIYGGKPLSVHSSDLMQEFSGRWISEPNGNFCVINVPLVEESNLSLRLGDRTLGTIRLRPKGSMQQLVLEQSGIFEQCAITNELVGRVAASSPKPPMTQQSLVSVEAVEYGIIVKIVCERTES